MTIQLDLLKRDWCEQMEIIVSGIRGEFTSDDLHPLLEKPEHQNWFGVLLARMKNKGLIQRLGYRASKRPERNGAVIAVWKMR